MFMKIIVLACGLLADGTETCKEYPETVESETQVSQQQCMSYATMAVLPEFARSHPNLTIKKWSCVTDPNKLPKA